MDKLEKYIKEKLEERTIAPSSNAWNKIASRVTGEPQRKGSKWYPYAIAASFIGVLLMSIFFFTRDNPEVEHIQVVETETKKETQLKSEEIVVQEFTEIEESKVVETEFDYLLEEKPEILIPKQSIINSAIFEHEIRQSLQDGIIMESDKLIAQKVDEVVAHVKHLETLHVEVSDAEVDSLLREAQKQILVEKLFTKSGNVDAMTLLAEVEDELDESFRDQIFDALKTGYFRLCTAVADRNE